MRKLRVIVVDDNPLFLCAARNLLSELPEVERVEFVNSGAEALLKATELCPDLVLMDIMIPGIKGLETMLILRNRIPALRMYAVTQHGFESFDSRHHDVHQH